MKKPADMTLEELADALAKTCIDYTHGAFGQFRRERDVLDEAVTRLRNIAEWQRRITAQTEQDRVDAQYNSRRF